MEEVATDWPILPCTKRNWAKSVKGHRLKERKHPMSQIWDTSSIPSSLLCYVKSCCVMPIHVILWCVVLYQVCAVLSCHALPYVIQWTHLIGRSRYVTVPASVALVCQSNEDLNNSRKACWQLYQWKHPVECKLCHVMFCYAVLYLAHSRPHKHSTTMEPVSGSINSTCSRGQRQARLWNQSSLQNNCIK